MARSLPSTPEIIVTQSHNGHYSACYSDYVAVWTSPSGHGTTREKAIANLAIDTARFAKHGTIEERIDRNSGAFAKALPLPKVEVNG